MPQAQKIQEPVFQVSLKTQDMVKQVQANKKKAKVLLKEAEDIWNSRVNDDGKLNKNIGISIAYSPNFVQKADDLCHQAIALDPARKDEITKKLGKQYLKMGLETSLDWGEPGPIDETPLNNLKSKVNNSEMLFDKAVKYLPSSKKEIHDRLFELGKIMEVRSEVPSEGDDHGLNPFSDIAKSYLDAAKRYE